MLLNRGDATAVAFIRVVLTSGRASMVLLNSEEACQVGELLPDPEQATEESQ